MSVPRLPIMAFFGAWCLAEQWKLQLQHAPWSKHFPRSEKVFWLRRKVFAVSFCDFTVTSFINAINLFMIKARECYDSRSTLKDICYDRIVTDCHCWSLLENVAYVAVSVFSTFSVTDLGQWGLVTQQDRSAVSIFAGQSSIKNKIYNFKPFFTAELQP